FETGPDGEPQLVLVQELDRHQGRGLNLAHLARDVRQAVAAGHELRIHDIWFLEPGALPRTSSGKVRRHACRTGYETGTLRRWRGQCPCGGGGPSSGWPPAGARYGEGRPEKSIPRRRSSARGWPRSKCL